MSLLTAVTGMDDRKKAGKATDKQAALIDQQIAAQKANAELAAKYQGPLLEALYGQINSNDPYNIAENNPNFQTVKAGYDNSADNAVQSLTDDFASRGFGMPSTGEVNPGLAAGAANIRSNEASQFSGWRADAIQRAIAQKKADQFNLYGAVSGLGASANAGLSAGAGELGGLAGMYTNNANSALGNIATLGTALATHGASLGIGGRGKDAGNNTLGTNQQVARPTGFYNPANYGPYRQGQVAQGPPSPSSFVNIPGLN